MTYNVFRGTLNPTHFTSSIRSTTTKDCYGLLQLYVARPRYTSRQKTTNVTHNTKRLQRRRLQRILLSPFDKRPAIQNEVASSDLEHVQTMLNQTLLMRLPPAFPVDDGIILSLMSDVHTRKNVLSSTPRLSRRSYIDHVHTDTDLPTAGHTAVLVTW